MGGTGGAEVIDAILSSSVRYSGLILREAPRGWGSHGKGLENGREEGQKVHPGKWASGSAFVYHYKVSSHGFS